MASKGKLIVHISLCYCLDNVLCAQIANSSRLIYSEYKFTIARIFEFVGVDSAVHSCERAERERAWHETRIA